MCGLVGIINLDKQQIEIDRKILAHMNDTQIHRGPDEGGTYVGRGVGLGHRRLSIIDLSSGQQPLFNEDGTVVVVFNGEIYNFQALAKELEQCGHTFKTHCDTEVIVHAWEQWGENCVSRFRGMFAFAIWDEKADTLFLARDRLGKKPLYYAFTTDNRLIFGSEFKSLLVYPGLNRTIDPRAVEDYFAYGYIPEPKTIFVSSFKLPPGHVMTVKRGGKISEPKQYWDIPFDSGEILPESTAAEELISRLKEATKIRLISDVPLGSFLSGGVDSSAIVAMMSELSQTPVSTCAISFGDPKFNESKYAKKVAELFHTDHQVEQVGTDDFELIETLASVYDEPYADSSAMPTYRVCELARKRVTVALSGDGGDENFAGYRRYRFHLYEEKLRKMLPEKLRKPMFRWLGEAYPKLDWMPRIFRAKATFESLGYDSVEGYFHSVSILGDKLRARLFSERFKKELQSYRAIEVFREHARKAPTDEPLSLVQYLDFKTYLVGDILTKVDRASMAHSLEVRVPLLDHEFVEWVSGLNVEQKLNGKQGKYIFKKALESRLPKDILYRSKMGFAVPLGSWFRGPLRARVRETLEGDTIRESGIFNMEFVKEIVDKHQAGVRDYSAAIWSIMMFEAFLRKHTQ